MQLNTITRDRWVRAGLCAALSILAFFSTGWPGNEVEHYLGGLLIWAGVIEIYDTFRLSDAMDRRAARMGGALSFLMGALLVTPSCSVLRRST